VWFNLRGRRDPLTCADGPREARRFCGGKVESRIVDPFGRAYSDSSQNDAGEVDAPGTINPAPAPSSAGTNHTEELTNDHQSVASYQGARVVRDLTTR